MPVHLLAGPDEVSIDDAVSALVASARLPAGMVEANLARFDAATFTLEAFRFACEAVPFLADGRVVICRGVAASLGAHGGAREGGAGSRARTTARMRKAGAPAGQRPPGEALAAYLPDVPATTTAIFLEAEPPAITSPLGEAFASRSVISRTFPLPEGEAMVRWLQERARHVAGAGARASSTMTSEAARLLASHVGSDLRLADSEVRKLVTFAGGTRAVEVRDVELLVPRAAVGAKAWELAQAMLDGQRDRAATALGQLLDGSDYRPEQAIASVRSAVAQHLRVSAMASADSDDATIARELRMHPFAVKVTRERGARLGDRALAYMHRQALDADHSIKSGRVANSRLAAELLVIELAARAVQAMQARPGSGRTGQGRGHKS